jgi:hypothetical protein
MTRHQATFGSIIDADTGNERPDPRGSDSPFVNITRGERLGRVLIGVAGIVTGIVLLLGAASATAVILEMLLVVAGLDMLVTGARGHCPLYARLGHLPKSLAGTR